VIAGVAWVALIDSNSPIPTRAAIYQKNSSQRESLFLFHWKKTHAGNTKKATTKIKLQSPTIIANLDRKVGSCCHQI